MAQNIDTSKLLSKEEAAQLLTHPTPENINQFNLRRAEAMPVDGYTTHLNQQGIDLSGLNMLNADLRRFDLSGANIEGADLSQAKTANTKFDGARRNAETKLPEKLVRSQLDSMAPMIAAAQDSGPAYREDHSQSARKKSHTPGTSVNQR